ncbi:MAG: T9SS type A sorting domain-containing protein [Sphingobacteriales bacterium]|nr:MAG: T9SS type A sorting domain-containing protein [Sphingobacteriales bacterium]
MHLVYPFMWFSEFQKMGNIAVQIPAMKKSTLVLLLLFGTAPLPAQIINVNIHVDVQTDRKSISPYIYGMNNGNYRHATWRRLGGNRLPVYSWETNYSHAGQDWFHEHDNYLPFILGVPAANYRIPGICLTTYHDTSLAQNTMTAITLPMAGYVASDAGGAVTGSQLAPSSRWDEVVNIKPSPLSLQPDTADQKVYVNEELNFLIDKYGKSHTATGIKAYVMDNEPGLWCNQYPRMRNNCVTYNELFAKSIALSGLIKSMDSAALVFGPESWGFSEFWNLQGASDPIATDHWFIDSYLKALKTASDNSGKRLLDIFSVHWYPQTSNVFSEDSSNVVAKERMQCTRTLWDSTYTENSWITASGFGDELPIIPHLQRSINQFNPSTALGITEYGWGGTHHISGGIAQADVLGIFGKQGVQYAALWPEVEGFLRSAFDLFLNYDGQGHAFGDISTRSTTSNISNAPVYASVEDSTNGSLHLIFMNKNMDSSVLAQVQIASNRNYNTGDAFYFNQTNTAIQHQTLPGINSNSFQYNLPPLSVVHLVLRDTTFLNISEAENHLALEIFPNPASQTFSISYETSAQAASLRVSDIAGKPVILHQVRGKATISTGGLTAGVYLVELRAGDRKLVKKLLVR